MEDYKKDFIEFLIQADVLKFGSFTLKSGRPSPYFINIGDMNDGANLNRLGEEFAKAISGLEGKVDVLFGPAYKGIPIAVAASIIALQKNGVNIGYACDRKEVKEHGEASGADLQKKAMMGKVIQNGNNIVIVEDVFTTGQTKYDALNLLKKSASDLKFPALVIAVDRQEIDANGESAVESFTRDTGIPVKSILTATDIYEYLEQRNDPNARKMEKYFAFYGTKDVQKFGRKLEEQVIMPIDRSVLVACDVATIEELEKIVQATADIPKVGGYKVGFELGLGSDRFSLNPLKELVKEAKYKIEKTELAEDKLAVFLEEINKIERFVADLPPELLVGGLGRAVDTIRKYTNKPIIYDHQKAGTDIPATGMNFARVLKGSGIDSAILFPQAGPETEKAWIYHLSEAGIKIWVGGPMTHPGYKASEGGFLGDEGVFRMIEIAASLGVNHFIAPGTKLEDFKRVREIVDKYNVKNPVYGSPGLITQGGTIEDAARVSGPRWHAIVGSGIYGASDMRQAAIEHCSQL